MKALSDVETGDEVVMQFSAGSGFRNGFRRLKVHRTTKTKIVVLLKGFEVGFSRTGSEVGGDRGFGSVWRELLPASNENLELVERYRIEQEQKRALNDLRDLVRCDLTPRQVQAAIEAIGNATQEDDE